MKPHFSLFSFLFLSSLSSFAQWSPLGGGINGNVNALCVYNSELYSGGTFNMAGITPANNIASWNGSTWSNLGAGVDYNGYFGVNAITVNPTNNNLYVGGLFDTAGGITNVDIAAWTGSAWQGLAKGVSGYSAGHGVHAVAVYNDSIYVGGSLVVTAIGNDSLNNIACWNYTTWGNVKKGMNGTVNALCVYNGNLYAGGSFSRAGGIPVRNIAQWNGSSWTPAGSGINGYGVYALTVYNGVLIAGGAFDSAGGVAAVGIAQWNGTNWAPLGKGIPLYGAMQALAVKGSSLVAGGTFDSIGGIPANNIGVWDGTSWSTLGSGINNAVFSLAIYNGNLYAGGSFDTAGGVPAMNIAEWSGPLAVNEAKGNSTSAKIYPNPSNGKFNVVLSGINGQSLVEVYNTLGQKVYTQTIKLNSNTQMDLSDNSEGIYLYRILTESGDLISDGKLVIEK